MKPKIHIPDQKLSELFPKPIFWDVNIEKLDWEADWSFIIERVLDRNLGRLHLLDQLDQIYPKPLIQRVAKESCSIRGFENIEYLAKRYGLEPHEFKNGTMQ